MHTTVLKRPVQELKKVNVKQDLFCRIYANDPECMGNATYAYMKAYGTESKLTAKANAGLLIKKPEITARINEYLQLEGFNNENVDKQLLYVINQHRDLSTKVKGIQEYNKLKKRVTDRLEIMIPKPLISLDEEEETPRKIYKKGEKEGEYTE